MFMKICYQLGGRFSFVKINTKNYYLKTNIIMVKVKKINEQRLTLTELNEIAQNYINSCRGDKKPEEVINNKFKLIDVKSIKNSYDIEKLCNIYFIGSKGTDRLYISVDCYSGEVVKIQEVFYSGNKSIEKSPDDAQQLNDDDIKIKAQNYRDEYQKENIPGVCLFLEPKKVGHKAVVYSDNSIMFSSIFKFGYIELDPIFKLVDNYQGKVLDVRQEFEFIV